MNFVQAGLTACAHRPSHMVRNDSLVFSVISSEERARPARMDFVQAGISSKRICPPKHNPVVISREATLGATRNLPGTTCPFSIFFSEWHFLSLGDFSLAPAQCQPASFEMTALFSKSKKSCPSFTTTSFTS